MKKLLFLGITIFGVTNMASAWEARYPQYWTQEGNRTTVSCKSQQTEKCMSGSGSSPQTGQACIIYHHGTEIPGRVIRATAVDNGPSEPPTLDIVAESSIAVQQAD